MAIAAFSGIGRERVRAQAPTRRVSCNPAGPLPRTQVGHLRLSHCRGNAWTSAGDGKNTAPLGPHRHQYHRSLRPNNDRKRVFNSGPFAWSAGCRDALGRLSTASFPTTGPTVASRKRATPLLFVLDWTYRLWQQFARFGLLHPVVLESLPAPMTESSFSGATGNW